MRDHRGIQALSLAVTALGAAALVAFAASRNVPPSDDTVLAEEVGRAVAAETLSLVGGQGRVVVFARDTSEFAQPAADAALGAFRRSLADAGREVAATRLIAEDPLRPLRVPEGDVFDVLRKSKTGDVLVSFLGPALLSEEQRAALGSSPHASVVAFCPGAIPAVMDLRRLSEMGLLHGAVVARTRVAATPTAPSGKAAFETQYRRADGKSLRDGSFTEAGR
jgi:hypothetical protein